MRLLLECLTRKPMNQLVDVVRLTIAGETSKARARDHAGAVGKMVGVALDHEERTALVLFAFDHLPHLNDNVSERIEAMRALWESSPDIEREAYYERSKLLWSLL